MKVRIVRDKAYLEDLRGCVVILDIIRASNTVIFTLGAGADAVYLLADLEEAKDLKRAHPSWLLWGERGGIRLPGFDGDNSPSQAVGATLSGKTVILTTSNGTQMVRRMKKAGTVLFGSFANASALVAAVRKLSPETVHLLPMGSRADEPALEDDAAADYLRSALSGAPPTFEPIHDSLLSSPAADALRKLSQQTDLERCTTLDSSRIVPVVVYESHPRAVALSFESLCRT